MNLLNYKKIGEGRPVLVLHGLFGSLDNWITIGNRLSEFNCEVYLIDQRNHGHSFHNAEHNYTVMCNDLIEFITHHNLKDVTLIGHSMGGKTAMLAALNYPELIEKLVVVDIAPKYYPVHHSQIIDALKSVEVVNIKTRLDAETILSKSIKEKSAIQFLLKNLYRSHNHFDWRFNLEAIEKNIDNVGLEIISDFPFTNPALFIRGEQSNYITTDDWYEIKTLFLNAQLQTIAAAGHWVHADKPAAFMDCITDFLKS